MDQAIQSSTIHIYWSHNGSSYDTQTNTSAVINLAVNTETYTFSDTGIFLWQAEVVDLSGSTYSSNRTVMIWSDVPEYNPVQNVTVLEDCAEQDEYNPVQNVTVDERGEEQDEYTPLQNVTVAELGEEQDEYNPVQSVEAEIIYYWINNDAYNATSVFEHLVYGWVNVTVTTFPSNDYLNYTDILVFTGSDAENFTHRYNHTSGAFTEISDPDNVTELSTNVSSVLVVDTNTTRINFHFTIHQNATDGWCDLNVSSFHTFFNLNDTDLILLAFGYNDVGIDDIWDLIDDFMDDFGLLNFMATYLQLINGVLGYFADSITNLVLLIVQQFRIITSISTWFIRWVTRLFTVVLSIGEILVGLFNGTGTVVTGLGNWWDAFEFATWGVTLLPLVVIILWIDSIAKRGRTQGEIRVFIDDMMTFTNVLSYFMTMFTMVINIVVDFVFRFIDYIAGGVF